MSSILDVAQHQEVRAAGLVDAVRYWGEAELAGACAVWGDLLSRSEADPLFMSWEWQSLWWHHHRELLGGQLAIVACYSGGRLVGLAPCYFRRATLRPGIRVTQCELIGSSFRDPRGVFSEYLDFIADRRFRESVTAAVAAHLSGDSRWSSLAVAMTPANGLAADVARHHLATGNLVRELDLLEAHRVDVPPHFPDYLAALSGSVRRKVWNQRKRLVTPRIQHVGADKIADAFGLIDRWQTHRWDASAQRGTAREFHQALAARLGVSGDLRLTTLECDGAPLSVMYNVRRGGTEYNLQSAFRPDAPAGISPAYLHFGYALEAAARDGITSFDFLAGEGRRRQYKEDFLTRRVPLQTLQVVRGRPLKCLYRVHRALMPSSRPAEPGLTDAEPAGE